jgi:hypothetical protein
MFHMKQAALRTTPAAAVDRLCCLWQTARALCPQTLQHICAPEWVQVRTQGQADASVQTACDRTTWRML